MSERICVVMTLGLGVLIFLTLFIISMILINIIIKLYDFAKNNTDEENKQD